MDATKEAGEKTARPRPAAVAATAFALVLVAGLLLHRGSLLYDTDAYYHLAVARVYATEGIVDDLRWTRLSVLHEGFGDKELLFHLLLAPFTVVGDAAAPPLLGGRWALALFGALAAAAVAGSAARVLGWWAALLPLLLAAGSTEMAWRAVRLRPELLALALLVAALHALGTARYRTAGVVAFLFALAYTAWHALAGLVALVFLHRAVGRRSPDARRPRRWPWPLLLYPLAGIGLGLVVHPHFPHNLEVWVVQSVDFFRLKDTLDVGSEIRPNFTDVTLMVNLGWWLALLVVWRAAEPVTGVKEADADAAGDLERGGLADAFGVAAAVFAVLYLLMSRFSLYAVPLVSLWTLHELARRGRLIGRRTRLPGGRTVSTALALLVCLLVALPEIWRQTRTYRQRTSAAGGAALRLADRAERAALLPPGARVAADWGDTATLMLWAPQATYLNALDPAFMAVPHPEAHRALRAVLDGEEPDVPLTTVTALDSEYLVVPRTAGYPRLTARLAADPRAVLLQRGSHDLYRFVPAPPGRFVVDWRLVPPGAPVPLPATADVARWPPYPLLAGPAGAFEAFVDGRRVAAADAGGCRRLVRDGALPAALELAPAGPTRLWIAGRPRVSVAGDLGAVPGGGVRLPAAAASGRLEVETCPAGDGAVGFYLSPLDAAAEETS